jgi:hypothetical protein
VAWSDLPSAPFTLNVKLTAQDYAQYFALAAKRQTTRSHSIIFLVVIFATIVVGLASHALATLETTDRVAIEIAGRYSLFAYAAGVLAMLLASVIVSRRGRANLVTSTPHALDAKTVVIDAEAVSMTGAFSQIRWTWPSFTQFTAARGLLCLWIGSQSAVIIPARAFASDEARKSAIAFIESKLSMAAST